MRRGVSAFPRIIKSPQIKTSINKQSESSTNLPAGTVEVLQPKVKRTASPFRIESQPLLSSFRFQTPSFPNPFRTSTDHDLKAKLDLQEVVKPHLKVNPVGTISPEKISQEEEKNKEGLNEANKRKNFAFKFLNDEITNAHASVQTKASTVFRFWPFGYKKPELVKEATSNFEGARKKREKSPAPDCRPCERKRSHSPKPQRDKQQPKEKKSPLVPLRKRQKKTKPASGEGLDVPQTRLEAVNFTALTETSIGDKKEACADESVKIPKDPLEERLKSFGVGNLINKQRETDRSKEDAEIVEKTDARPCTLELNSDKSQEYLQNRKSEIRSKQALETQSGIGKHSDFVLKLKENTSSQKTNTEEGTVRSTVEKQSTDSLKKKPLRGYARTQIDQGLLRKRKDIRKAASTSRLTERARSPPAKKESQTVCDALPSKSTLAIRLTESSGQEKSTNPLDKGSSSAGASSQSIINRSPQLGRESFQYLRELAFSKKGFVAQGQPSFFFSAIELPHRNTETVNKQSRTFKRVKKSASTFRQTVQEEESVIPSLQTFLKDLREILLSQGVSGKDQKQLSSFRTLANKPENKGNKDINFQLPKKETGTVSEIINNTISDVKPLFEKLFEQLRNSGNKK